MTMNLLEYKSKIAPELNQLIRHGRSVARGEGYQRIYQGTLLHHQPSVALQVGLEALSRSFNGAFRYKNATPTRTPGLSRIETNLKDEQGRSISILVRDSDGLSQVYGRRLPSGQLESSGLGVVRVIEYLAAEFERQQQVVAKPATGFTAVLRKLFGQ